LAGNDEAAFCRHGKSLEEEEAFSFAWKALISVLKWNGRDPWSLMNKAEERKSGRREAYIKEL
jgi:hypothetical protein